MKVVHAEDIATENIKHKRSIQELQCIHETSKFKYKSFVHERLRKHAEHSDKKKDQMNSLRELLFGQSNMIDGCVEENRDERRKSKQATNLAVSKEVLAVNRLAKVILWKSKCVELCAHENEYAAQSSKIDDMELQRLEYELIIEETADDYEATIHSLYPRMIEKMRVKNRTSNYGHQEWKPYIDELIIKCCASYSPHLHSVSHACHVKR
jgi:hypothetical protein